MEHHYLAGGVYLDPNSGHYFLDDGAGSCVKIDVWKMFEFYDMFGDDQFSIRGF